MNNEVTVITPEQFGLEKKEASNIEKAFEPKIKEREILSTLYGELVKKDITQETCIEATELRRKLVKVRTGISDIHKTQKSFFLAAGKFVDAWKNKETLPVTHMEDGLRKIENHFEAIEEQKREKIRQERNAELEQYEYIYDAGDVAGLDDILWGHFMRGIKADYEEKKAEEIRAEKERIEEQKKQDLFTARKEKLIQFSQFGIYEKLTIDTGEKEFIAIVQQGEKAKIDFDIEQEKIRKENERLKKEADLKQIADEKAEKERQRLAKIEQDKRDKIERDRQAKAESERKQREAKEDKERVAHELELKRVRDDRAKIQKAFEARQEEAKKAEKERQRLAKIEQDKRDKIERERLDKERKLKARNINRNKELRPYLVFIRDYNGLLNSGENEYRKQLEDIKEGAELQWMSDRKEQQRKAAQEKIDREEKERLRKESVAEIEANRKAELAPDKERMTKWISDMVIIDIVNDRMGKESVLMASEIIDKFNAFKNWATEKVNEIK